MKNVMVVAPHPDDETLGCGGTILKYLASGDKVIWVIFSRMSKHSFSDELITKRRSEIEQVSKMYSGIEIVELEFEAANLDKYPDGEVVSSFSEILKKHQPSIIYTPFHNDIHTDHHKVFTACSNSIKTFRYPFVTKVLMYETLSETNFLAKPSQGVFYPNVYSDISNFLDKKIEIMNIYESEIFSHPFPRSSESIKAQATMRGSEAGVQYAEAFMLLKEIW